MTTASLTLSALRSAIDRREVSAQQACRDALDRIDRLDGTLHAYLEVFHDRAMEQAGAIDRRIASGEPAHAIGPLAGVPIALKDNLCLEWGRTTCASRILENYQSPYTATAVRRLLDAGAVVLGKTNLDEFAMGSSTEHSAFGPSRNPWDAERVPGGSSGGSATAVGARMAHAALGSDTGGSVRQPAALCGIVGYKPTYGLVSRYGLVAFASSLDQIGPFGRTVEDAAIVATAMFGHDPLDSTSADIDPPDLVKDLERPVEGLRLGVPVQCRSDRNHPGCAKALEDAIRVYRDLGATVVDIDLPRLEHGIAAYYIVAPAEASSNLARYDGVRYGRRAELSPGEDLMALYARSRAEGFGPEVQRRIILGTYVLSSGYYDAYYLTALKARRLIKQDFDEAFATDAGRPGVHAVLTPSTLGPAFRVGEKIGDPLALYLEDLYTVSAPLAGLPGVSIPAGFTMVDGRDLPVGVQLVGPAFDDARLLRIARMFEKAADHSRREPPL